MVAVGRHAAVRQRRTDEKAGERIRRAFLKQDVKLHVQLGTVVLGQIHRSGREPFGAVYVDRFPFIPVNAVRNRIGAMTLIVRFRLIRHGELRGQKGGFYQCGPGVFYGLQRLVQLFVGGGFVF